MPAGSGGAGSATPASRVPPAWPGGGQLRAGRRARGWVPRAGRL